MHLASCALKFLQHFGNMLKTIIGLNRSTERIIGKMKRVIQSKIVDILAEVSKTDIPERFRAFLSNVE